jgi:hypothetical protein
VLDLISWPTGPAVRTAADVPWDTLVSLGVIWGPVSVLLAVPGLWCINRYSLDRERHREIQRRLGERRARHEDQGASPEEPGTSWERARASEARLTRTKFAPDGEPPTPGPTTLPSAPAE